MQRLSAFLLFSVLCLGALAAWPQESAAASRLDLTRAEREFVAANPVITFSDVARDPLAVTDYGLYRGMLRDYYDVVEELTGLRFAFKEVDEDGSFKQVLDALADKRIDMIDGTGGTLDRARYGLFAGPFFSFPMAIAAPKGESLTGLGALDGLRVAVAEDSEAAAYLAERAPGAVAVTAPDPRQALVMVSQGRADAMLDNLAVVGHGIRTLGLDNLGVSGLTDYRYDVYSLVRDDWPLLASILDKAHAAVPERDKERIYSRWAPILTRRTLETGLSFTDAEREFLATHPVFTASNELDWPPFNFNEEGRAKGYSVDYLRLLADKLGVEVRFVSGPSWEAFMELLAAKEIDVVCNMAKSEEREKFALFTRPYSILMQGLAFRKGTIAPQGIQSMRGKVLASPAGFFGEEVVRRHYPGVRVKTFRDQLECLQAVAAGKADASLGSLPVMSYLIRKNFLTDLSTVPLQDNRHFTSVGIRYGVRGDWGVFRDILQKAMDAVSEPERQALAEKWFGSAEDAGGGGPVVPLTPAEVEYLRDMGRVRFCGDPDWMPFERVTADGSHEGMVAEYMNLMAGRIGVGLSLVPTANWNETLETVRAGNCDLVAAITPTEARGEFLEFTRPYLDLPLVMAARTGTGFVEDLDRLENATVGAVDGYATVLVLENNYPGLDVVRVQGVGEGLEKVASGELFAFVDTLPAITYAINQKRLLELKIVGRLDETMEVAVGVSKRAEPLRGVFDKAVATISPAEREAIFSKWISLKFEHGVDYSLVWKAVGAALVVLAVVVWWNRKLSALNRKVSRARDELDRANARLGALLDNSGQGFLSVDEKGTVSPLYSRECERLFGPDLAGRKVQDLLLPGDEAAAAELGGNIARVLGETDEFRRGLYLSLMRSSFEVDRRALEVEYRPIDDARLMVVATDVSEKRRLAETVSRERERLRLVVSAVTDPEGVAETVASFARFEGRLAAADGDFAATRQGLEDLYREVHTFKGQFAQLDFAQTPAALHEFESALSALLDRGEAAGPGEPAAAFAACGAREALAGELAVLEQTLGAGFLEHAEQVRLDPETARGIKALAGRLLERANELGLDGADRRTLAEAAHITHVELADLLAPHAKAAASLAVRLGKELAPVEVAGGGVRVDPEVFGSLAASLTHVFRNAVVHGIEVPGEREAAGKPRAGRISCRVAAENDAIRIEVADDGAGIDPEETLRAAVAAGALGEAEAAGLSRAEALKLVFSPRVSTAESVDAASGRGIGLSAVKAALGEVGGDVAVTSTPGRGTTLVFTVPWMGKGEPR